MDNKDTSTKIQTKNNEVDCHEDNTNGIYVDPNIGKQDGTSNFPFYTPEGEGPQPRITSS